jgi:NADH-quinone oxidoreductase subunit A
MLRSYIPIFLFIAIATGFAMFTIVFARLVSAGKPNAVKLEPYECGIEAKATRAIATASATT